MSSPINQYYSPLVKDMPPDIYKKPSPNAQNKQFLDRKIPVERDITQEYIPPPGVPINVPPTRKKSSPNPPVQVQRSPQPRPCAPSNADILDPPPKMRGLESDPKSPSKQKGKAVVLVLSNLMEKY